MSLLDPLRSLVPRSLKARLRRRREERELDNWEAAGRPVPPPHIVKQQVIREYSDRFDLKVLVETGTFMGAMVEAQRQHFERIYSIELSEELYAAAARRFRRDSHITILQGDSGKVLRELVPQLTQPTLFWLDGHYSGGVTALGEGQTPISSELQTILAQPEAGHRILIDDARCFGTIAGYPTIDEVRTMVQHHWTKGTVDVADDIIHIVTA